MGRFLPAFRAELNDRAFVSLDRASGFWFTPFSVADQTPVLI
jgi:hypothetical protein